MVYKKGECEMEKSTNHNKEDKSNKEVDKSRRHFLKNTGIATGGVIGGLIFGGLLPNPFKSDKSTSVSTHQHDSSNMVTEAMQFFTRREDFDTLAAAAEVIFPEDEHGAGAIGLGVHYYIDKQLATPWGSNTDDYRKRPFLEGETPLTRGDIMLTGLRKLNEVSQTKHNELFRELEESIQIEILQSFEVGEVEMKLVSSASFFALLRQLTLEGCYSDPLYGGNKDMEGWKMKEFPGAYMSYIDVVEANEFVYKEPVNLSNHM